MTAPSIQLLIPSAFYLGYLAAFFTQSIYYVAFMHYLLWIVIFGAAFYRDPDDYDNVTQLVPLSAIIGSVAGLMVARALQLRVLIRVTPPKVYNKRSVTLPNTDNEYSRPWFLIASAGLVLFIYAIVAGLLAPPAYGLWLGDNAIIAIVFLAMGAFMLFAAGMMMVWSFDIITGNTSKITRTSRVNSDWLTVYYSFALILCIGVPALLYERVDFADNGARVGEGVLAAFAVLVIVAVFLGIGGWLERRLYNQTNDASVTRLGIEWWPILFHIGIVAITALVYYLIGGVLSTDTLSNTTLFVWLGLYSLLLIIVSGAAIALLQLMGDTEKERNE